MQQSDAKIGVRIKYIFAQSPYHGMTGTITEITYSTFQINTINTIKVEFDNSNYYPNTVWFIFNPMYFELINDANKSWNIDVIKFPKESACNTCGKMNDVGVNKCWFCESKLRFEIFICKTK